MTTKFSFRARLKSLTFALEGIRTFFRTQHNSWIHVVAALAAVAAGWYFRISKDEWCWIILSISLVFVTEMVNTAIEFLSDFVSPAIHPQIKKVKDVSAAAVLFAAAGAVIIGCIVFLPKIC